MTPRIAIVDDHPLMRQGIEYALRREKHFNIVAGAARRRTRHDRTRPRARRHSARYQLPGFGLAAAKTIAETNPTIRIRVITVSERHEDVHAALKAGARGYILESIGGSDPVQTIRSVAAGETYITPQFAARLLTKPTEIANPAADTVRPLSLREQQILKAVSLGLATRRSPRRSI